MTKEIQTIVSKDGEYHLYNYQSEAELEEMVVEHSKNIFGENTYYFNIKKRIHSKAGFGTEPDGYVIDFEKKKLYVIEVELIKHDLRRHVIPQITNFIMALDNAETPDKLAKMFQEELPFDKKINEKEIKSIINNREIIIIIDDIGDSGEEGHNKLFEVIKYLNNHNEEIKAIPFQTYIKGENYSQDHLHSFRAFTKEELEKEAKKWTFKWTTVPVEEHLKKLDDNSKIVFKNLSNKICCIASDIKEVHRKNWVTYQISKLGNFSTIKFPKGYLEIHMKVNKDNFRDEKKITQDIKRTPAWTFDKIFIIKSQEDVDYAVYLIEQAYQCICETKK